METAVQDFATGLAKLMGTVTHAADPMTPASRAFLKEQVRLAKGMLTSLEKWVDQQP